eukprot:231374_1
MDDRLLFCRHCHHYPNLPFKVNDVVEINSDPEDDDPQSHIHIGQVLKIKHTKQELIVKHRNLKTTYSLPEIGIHTVAIASPHNNTEVQQMKAVIASMEKKIAAKKWKLRKCEAKARQMKKEKEDLRMESDKSIHNLKSLLESVRMAKRDMEATNEQLISKLKDAKKDSEKYQSECKRLQSVESDWVQIAIELEKEKAQKEKLEKKVYDYSKAHDGHMKQNRELREQIQTATADKLMKHQRCEAEKEQKQRLAIERCSLVVRLQQQVDEAEKKCDVLREKLDDMISMKMQYLDCLEDVIHGDNDEDSSDTCNVTSQVIQMKRMRAEITRLRLILTLHEIDVTGKPMNSEMDKDVASGSCDPVDPLNIEFNRVLTTLAIPKRCQEQFSNVEVYLKEYLFIHREDAVRTYSSPKQHTMQVIDFNLHCKKTGKRFYVVCQPQPLSAEENDATVWKANNTLYFATDIESLFEIASTDLPKASLESTIALKIQKARKQVTSRLLDVEARNNWIKSKKTPWTRRDKIPIHNKTTRYGTNIMLTKEDFATKLKQYSDAIGNDIELVPILRCTEHKCNVEMAWIVDIGPNQKIAISLQVDARNRLRARGIYLDINDAHMLAHMSCDNCVPTTLRGFKTGFDRLEIGASQPLRLFHSKVSKATMDYDRLRKEDEDTINEMMTACTELECKVNNTQTFVDSLLQEQTKLDQISVAQTHFLNALCNQQQMLLPNMPLQQCRTLEMPPYYNFNGSFYKNQLVSIMQ